jgi:hypothetical protein
MSYVVGAFGVVLAAFGAVVIVSPDVMVSVLEEAPNLTVLYVGAAIRLLVGIAVLRVAPKSRAPITLAILGVMFIAGCVVGPLMGVEGVRKYIEFWLGFGPAFIRPWGVMALVLGSGLTYAVIPRTRAA